MKRPSSVFSNIGRQPLYLQALAINVNNSLDSSYNYSAIVLIVAVHLPALHVAVVGSVDVTVALGVDVPLTSSIVKVLLFGATH